MPATFAAATQTLAKAALLGNLWVTTSWFSKIVGLMQWSAAMETPFLPVGCSKIEVDTMKKLKKADSLNKLW